MKYLTYCLSLLSLSFFTTACFQQKEKTVASHSANFELVFANQSLGRKHIVTDKIENFFGKIQMLDVAIQMQRPLESLKKETFVAEYKQFLQADVLEFSTEEQERLQSIFDGIQGKLDAISIDIDFGKIVLIKTGGAGYGDQAFYTRENTIVIPKGQLANNEEQLNGVMLHELFHIYSRYNVLEKQDIYKMIGFHPIEGEIAIQDPALKAQTLLNPDGLAMNYYIDLKDKKGNSIKAVPMIYSTYDSYKEDIKDFFTYLKFDLYRLESKDGKEIVLSQGVSTDVEAEYFDSFFGTIADNTQYIIHPDEIMADNFMLMVEAYAKNDFSKFSKEGKTLIEKLYAYLSDN